MVRRVPRVPAGLRGAGATLPRARFAWLDVEDDAEEVGEREIENFPTIEIRRGEKQLFYGVLLPRPEHLSRLLEEFLSK